MMDELKRLFRAVESNLKQNISCDRDIFVVLNPRANKEILTECGNHLIEVINGVRKAANVEKRKDYPNLVLVQTIRAVPETSNNIVYWNSRVFGETLAIRLEQIARLLHSSTVYNPFVTRDGCLVNSYGPIQKSLNLNPCGHELNHDSFKDSLHEVIIRESKVFSIFQTFVHGIFYSQYCDHCLLLLLNFMETTNHVSKLAWNLSRGVWSPKTHKEMEQCFDWKQDDEKLYKPNCWRLLEDEFQDVDYFGPVSSSSSENLTSDFSNCRNINNEKGGDVLEDVVFDSYEVEDRNYDTHGTTAGFVDVAAGIESFATEFIIEDNIDSLQKKPDEEEVVKQPKPTVSSTKRRRFPTSKGSGRRAKRRKTVAKAGKPEEERTDMFIKRIVDSGFRIPKRQENVFDLLPKDQSIWNRDHHRMAALGYTYYSLQQFNPDFLENRSGRNIKFKPVVIEESEEESDGDETSNGEPSTSESGSDRRDIVSADGVSPSSTDSSTQVQNGIHDELDGGIMENSEKTLQVSAGEPSGFEKEAQDDEQDELNEVVMEPSADASSSDCTRTSGIQEEIVSISQNGGSQDRIDNEIVLPENEQDIIILDYGDEIILGDSDDDDVICLD